MQPPAVARLPAGAVIFYGLPMDNADPPMPTFQPRLDRLPPPQRALWAELDATPDHFTLYGGTALALRPGHRQSIDFYFFSHAPFNPGDLAREIPYLAGAEQAGCQPYIDLPDGTRRPGAGVLLR